MKNLHITESGLEILMHQAQYNFELCIKTIPILSYPPDSLGLKYSKDPR